MKKRKQKDGIEWKDLQVGDFVEDEYYRFFCYKIEERGPACLGGLKWVKAKIPFSGVYRPTASGYTLMIPTKSFINFCKKLLKLNLEEYNLDNLSYIEALSKLK